ncbi:hypothetical protein GBA52_014299 [Prunus armeniaca]|nr:hypothetical protein GBA52_014299 [Prunus armeniaca]
MDRQIAPHFNIPAGSILVIVFISTAISLTVIDRFLWPTWQKLTGQFPTFLQRIGLGHVLNILGMVVSALVESKRLKIAKTHHLQDQLGAIVPMLALWLFPTVNFGRHWRGISLSGASCIVLSRISGVTLKHIDHHGCVDHWDFILFRHRCD